MSTKDYGEPWTRLRGDMVDRGGSIILYGSDFSPVRRDRAIACVNACAGMVDPASALAAAREALERAIEVMREYPMYPDDADGYQLDEVQKGLEKVLALLAPERKET